MKFNLTENAQKELAQILSRYEAEAPVVRIAVRGYSCAGPQFHVILDTARSTDYKEAFLNTEIVVDSFYIEKLEGFHLDFTKNLFNKGFVVRPFKFIPRC